MVGARKFNYRYDRVEMNADQVIAKWRGLRGIERVYPEGQDYVGKHITNFLLKICKGRVCEVGCGTGRIAKIFDPSRYIGIDINQSAIDIARFDLPKHKFKDVWWGENYPEADTYLFYTVLLHIPDEEVFYCISRTSGRVVVAEPMMRHMRWYGLSNNFQRDATEYKELFNKHDMKEMALYHTRLPYFPYFINIGVYSDQ